MLTNGGPMTLEAFVQTTQLHGADAGLFERFLSEHASEFTLGPNDTYWFTDQPRPVLRDFESISHALAFALGLFPEGASVEELSWYLCMSTVNGSKAITRRSVSRELSRRTDLFRHLSRARYTLIEGGPIEEPQPVPPPLPPLPVILPLPELAPPVAYPFFAVPIPAPPEDNLQAKQPPDDDDFDPFAFFGHDFQFAFE
jgi:hypothetical protein